MTALSRMALATFALAAAGCASTPVPIAAPDRAIPSASPMVMSSGLVIGTMSYHYVDVGAQPQHPGWVVHLTRVDAPAPQDYAMVVEVDPATRRGVFTGALPPGVYAFHEAARANHHYASGGMKMPFEIQAGAVQDAGHYALNPIPVD